MRSSKVVDDKLIPVSIYLTILGSEIPKKVPAAIISSVAQYNLPSSTLSALIPALLSGDTGELLSTVDL